MVFPLMTEAAYKGWIKAEQDLLRFGALVDFDEVNPAIMEAVSKASLESVKLEGPQSWVASTREQLRQAMTRFYAAPEVEENDFVAALEPIFGRKRAEGIAITEMTRIYSDASLETARHATAEAMYDVSTVNDERVCEECLAAEKNGPYELDDEEHKTPLHNRCRCDTVIVGRKT